MSCRIAVLLSVEVCLSKEKARLKLALMDEIDFETMPMPDARGLGAHS